MLLQRLNNRKGFTLIELMIVIFIILILSATLVPLVLKCTVSTKVNAPEKMSIQQKPKAVVEKPSTTPKQKEVTKQSEDMKKL